MPSPPCVFALGDFVSHSVKHGDSFVRVIQQMLDALHVAGIVELCHGKAFAQAVRGDVLAAAEQPRGPLKVFVNGLSRAVALAGVAVRENINVARQQQRAALELLWERNPAILAGFLLLNGEPALYGLFAREREYVPDAQPGSAGNLTGEPVFSGQRTEYMLEFGLKKPVRTHVDTSIIQSLNCKLRKIVETC